MHKIENAGHYIAKKPEWNKELILLRDILLSSNLDETIKWGSPVYCKNGKNIVGLGAFKSYVGLWFFQGALLKDKHKKLINAQEDKTKALRQWRFSSFAEIEKIQKLILAYVKEAIKNCESGKEIKPERNKKIIIPKELEALLKKNKNLMLSFHRFTPGKQREFVEFITEAKREDTKVKRIEKIKPMILKGIGLNDKYKN